MVLPTWQQSFEVNQLSFNKFVGISAMQIEWRLFESGVKKCAVTLRKMQSNLVLTKYEHILYGLRLCSKRIELFPVNDCISSDLLRNSFSMRYLIFSIHFLKSFMKSSLSTKENSTLEAFIFHRSITKPLRMWSVVKRVPVLKELQLYLKKRCLHNI